MSEDVLTVTIALSGDEILGINTALELLSQKREKHGQINLWYTNHNAKKKLNRAVELAREWANQGA